MTGQMYVLYPQKSDIPLWRRALYWLIFVMFIVTIGDFRGCFEKKYPKITDSQIRMQHLQAIEGFAKEIRDLVAAGTCEPVRFMQVRAEIKRRCDLIGENPAKHLEPLLFPCHQSFITNWWPSAEAPEDVKRRTRRSPEFRDQEARLHWDFLASQEENRLWQLPEFRPPLADLDWLKFFRWFLKWYYLLLLPTALVMWLEACFRKSGWIGLQNTFQRNRFHFPRLLLAVVGGPIGLFLMFSLTLDRVRCFVRLRDHFLRTHDGEFPQPKAEQALWLMTLEPDLSFEEALVRVRWNAPLSYRPVFAGVLMWFLGGASLSFGLLRGAQVVSVTITSETTSPENFSGVPSKREIARVEVEFDTQSSRDGSGFSEDSYMHLPDAWSLVSSLMFLSTRCAEIGFLFLSRLVASGNRSRAPPIQCHTIAVKSSTLLYEALDCDQTQKGVSHAKEHYSARVPRRVVCLNADSRR